MDMLRGKKMADLNGFIKLYRQMIKWNWYKNIPVKVLFLHCLFMANYQDDNLHGRTVKRGSFYTTIDDLSQQTGLTVQEIRTALKKLISTGEIIKKSTTKDTLITVVNYDKFQGIGLTNENGYKSVNKVLKGQKSNINFNKQINKEINNVENYENSAQQGVLEDVENLFPTNELTNQSTSQSTNALTNGQQTNNKRSNKRAYILYKEDKEIKEYKEVEEVSLSFDRKDTLSQMFPELDWEAYDEEDFLIKPANLYVGKKVVFLSTVQEDMLYEKLGIDAVNYYVEKLADFIIKNNAKVRNHYATILKWSREDNEL